MAITAAPASNFCGVLSETKRILDADTRHFAALTAIFLFPLSFALYLYPFLLQPNPQYSQHPIKALIFHLLYSLFVVLFSTCATGAVIHSSYHGLHGRPLQLISSIKSLSSSFLPLVATSLASQILLTLIVMAFGISVALILIAGAQLLGLEIDYTSNYFLISAGTAILVIVTAVSVYVNVNWCLASVIVVVESKWGMEPLRRSRYLVRGMRRAALGIMLLYGCPAGILTWGSRRLVEGVGGDQHHWWRWELVAVNALLVPIVVGVLMLYTMVAMTVMYVSCKANHGELSGDGDYVRLPVGTEEDT